MAREWTQDQQRVLETTDSNLLVSAAAGSGKTAVLVERIIRMVTDEKNPADIDRFIIMTFTRAAAAQMRQKIALELEKRQLSEGDSRLLRRQLRLIGNACISTIDSFCIGIVRSYFHVLDLDPSFRVADETELALIRSDCMDAVMESRYGKKEEASEEYRVFCGLLEGYCNHKGDSAITSVVFSLADKALSHPWPLEWLDGIRRDYSLNSIEAFDNSMIASATVSHVHSMLQRIDEKLEQGMEICRLENGPDYFTPMFKSDLELVNSIMKSEKYSEMSALLFGYSFMQMSRTRKGDPELRERAGNLRNAVKNIISDIISKFFFYPADEILNTIVKSKKYVDGIISLTGDYLEAFAKAKRAKNIIDFSDAEHFALEILLKKDESGKRVRSEAAFELQKQYHEIIIDEYQDSNEIQECIANAIAGSAAERPYVFTVGDVKQSIYKFRNACPEIFVEKQKLYESGDGSGRLISLDRNFRSREEVLEGTNAIFRQIMHENLGGIEYDERCSLKCGTEAQKNTLEWQDTPYRTELILINRDGDEGETASDIPEGGEESGDSVAAESAREREARAVAHRIRHLIFEERLKVRSEINGKETERCAEYGDIVILLRTMKGWADVFCRVFEEEGIPALSDVSDGFFKSSEIMLVLDVLSIIDNPRRDIPLTAVLTSVIGGFDVNDLADIKIVSRRERLNGHVTFYDELLNASTDTGGTGEKIRAFLELYERLRCLKNDMSISELIGEIYKKTGIYSYYSAMPDGEKRCGNLDLLSGYAADYEKTGYSGLFSFMRYLDKLKSSDQDYGDAGNSRADNCVRIMSIHKSKGLEFPVVILAGAGKTFNRQDMRGDIIASSSHGLGLKYVDTVKRVKYNSFHHSVIITKASEDMVAEEMRLLYVAMTRAKEKIIMMGTVKKLPQELNYHSLFNSTSFVDFLYIPAINCEECIKTVVITPEAAGDYARLGSCFENGRDSAGTDAEAAMAAGENQAGEAEALNGNSTAGSSVAELLRVRKLKYPYGDEAVLPVKLSVSDLKLEAIDESGIEELMFENEVFDPEKKTIPAFMENNTGADAKESGLKLSGALYGTLMHRVMQFIPMKLRNEAQVKAFLKEMCTSGKLDCSEYKRLRAEPFTDFLNSSLADRIRRADSCGNFMREKQFMMGMKACEISSEKYGRSEELIPIQGVIDAMFEEDGELVILDYKTDRVDAESAGEKFLISRYRVQLGLYARAAEQLTGMKVKEMYLYSFSLGKEIKL